MEINFGHILMAKYRSRYSLLRDHITRWWLPDRRISCYNGINQQQKELPMVGYLRSSAAGAIQWQKNLGGSQHDVVNRVIRK